MSKKIIVTLPEDPSDHNTGETAIYNFIVEENIPIFYTETRQIGDKPYTLEHYILPQGLAVFLDPKHVTFHNINAKALQ